MTQNILTIGFELAIESCVHAEFSEKLSLLDWDIILIQPRILEFIGSRTYKGKPSLDAAESFQLRESCEHWRREIKQASDNGKLVIVFMSALTDVYIDSGEKTYSGSGRNRSVTTLVEPYNNYKSIERDLNLTIAKGSSMRLTKLGSAILQDYWKTFGKYSKYEVIIKDELEGVAIVTNKGDLPTGVISKSNNSCGAIFLLPSIDFDRDEFFSETDDESSDSAYEWTSEAKKFASSLINAVITIYKNLHLGADLTPEPTWVSDAEYMLLPESALRAELLDAERKLEDAQATKEIVKDKLKELLRIKYLLYEQGSRLEEQIINALRVIGFNADNYKVKESEFDVVFESAEGRLIGEAEGKDNKAINVEKLRQLNMNINEDLIREEVDRPAKGVIFGNGYRMTPPDKRPLQFTEKCISASRVSNTALVSTSELYKATKYLIENADDTYARSCRIAMLEGVGIVDLPAPPIAAGGPCDQAVDHLDQ